MASTKPFRRFELHRDITDKLVRIRAAKRYRGSMTSFIETVLDDYAEWFLKKMPGKKEVVTAAGAEWGGKAKENEQRAS